MKNQWSKWSNDHKANFTNLGEGSYVFKVKARNVYFHESEIAAFHFVILAPWYRSWWAYIIYLLGGVFVIYTGVKLNTRRLIVEKEKLEGIVKERTAEVTRQKEEIDLRNKDLAQKNDVLAEQKAVIEENHKSMTSSIRYAQRIQEAILPDESLIKNQIPDSFVLFLPRDIVSGDFYWFTHIKDTSIISVIDCTGHGVPGAFMSMIGYSLLNEIVNEKNILQPAQILNELKTGVINALNQQGGKMDTKDGMDMALCSIQHNAEDDTFTLQFAGAYNPIYIISKHNYEPLQSFKIDDEGSSQEDNHLFEVKGDRQPIGISLISTQKPFTNHTIQLSKGDCIYIFSDGYADQFGGDQNRKFNYRRLKSLIVKIHHMPMLSQKDKLQQSLREWQRDHEQIDDVCVMGIKL